MEINKSIFIIAFLITLFLLMLMLLIGSNMNNQRYKYINTKFSELYTSFNEMQTFFLMAETFGDEMACLTFEKKLKEMDKSIWELAVKIDQYRIATEEFQKDKYYLEQKRAFNENEIFYLTLLKNLNERCSFDQSIILFFYQNSADCKKCDDQSFVLDDINKQYDDDVAIFSFDMDLNISTAELLKEYYNVDKLPCIVIENGTFCGIRSKDFVLKKLCELKPSNPLCD